MGGGWGGGRASWGTSDKVLFVANENDPRWTAQSDERVQRLVRESVGFRRVFSALSASRRTMVVHNGLYDLMFLMDKFHAPLPPSLTQFKQLVRESLGDIFDTKVLMSSPSLTRLSALQPPLISTSLSDCWAALKTHASLHNPRVTLPSAFRRYRTKCLHDAGWDALATGEIFAKVSRLVRAEEAKEMRGKLFVTRSPYSIFLYRLDNHDSLAQSGVYFVMTGLNTSVTTAHVQRLFEPLQTKVSWADDYRAFVHVLHASQSEAHQALNKPGRGWQAYLDAGAEIMSHSAWQNTRGEKGEVESRAGQSTSTPALIREHVIGQSTSTPSLRSPNGGRSTELGSPNERSADVGAKGGRGSMAYSLGGSGGRRLSNARERSRCEGDADLEAMSAPKRMRRSEYPGEEGAGSSVTGSVMSSVVQPYDSVISTPSQHGTCELPLDHVRDGGDPGGEFNDEFGRGIHEVEIGPEQAAMLKGPGFARGEGGGGGVTVVSVAAPGHVEVESSADKMLWKEVEWKEVENEERE